MQCKIGLRACRQLMCAAPVHRVSRSTNDDVSRCGCSLETPCKLPIMHADFSMQCAIGLPACRQPMRAAPGRPSFPFYERRRKSARVLSGNSL
jgi:hypothetical protein